MDANQIASEILLANLTGEDCQMLSKALARAYELAQAKAKVLFNYGDKCYFIHRNGERIDAIVTKVSRKFIYVKELPRADGERALNWKVAPTSLKKA